MSIRPGGPQNPFPCTSPPITDVSYNSATGQCFCGTGLYLVDNTACCSRWGIISPGTRRCMCRENMDWVNNACVCVSGFVMDFGVDRCVARPSPAPPPRPPSPSPRSSPSPSPRPPSNPPSDPPNNPPSPPNNPSSPPSNNPSSPPSNNPITNSVSPNPDSPSATSVNSFSTFLPTTLTTTLDNGTVLINTIPGIIVAVPIATPTTTLTPISTQSSSSPSPVLSNSAITITSVSVVAAITAVSACLFFVYRRRMKKMNAMNPNPPTGQSGEAVSTVTPSDTVFAADAKYPLQASSGTPVSVYMLDIKQPIPANATYETSQPVLLALKQPVSSGNVKTINGGAFKETAGAIERTRSEALPMYSEGDRQTVEATPIFLSKK